MSLQLTFWLVRYWAAALSPYLAIWTKHVTASSTCNSKGQSDSYHNMLSQQFKNTCIFGNIDTIPPVQQAHTSGRSMSSPLSSSAVGIGSTSIGVGSSAMARLASRRGRFCLTTAENKGQVDELSAVVNM